MQKEPLARLDDILKDVEPTLIKVDVDGYEINGLWGAAENLAKSSLQPILMDTIDPQAQVCLTRHEFPCGTVI